MLISKLPQNLILTGFLFLSSLSFSQTGYVDIEGVDEFQSHICGVQYTRITAMGQSGTFYAYPDNGFNGTFSFSPELPSGEYAVYVELMSYTSLGHIQKIKTPKITYHTDDFWDFTIIPGLVSGDINFAGPIINGKPILDDLFHTDFESFGCEIPNEENSMLSFSAFSPSSISIDIIPNLSHPDPKTGAQKGNYSGEFANFDGSSIDLDAETYLFFSQEFNPEDPHSYISNQLIFQDNSSNGKWTATPNENTSRDLNLCFNRIEVRVTRSEAFNDLTMALNGGAILDEDFMGNHANYELHSHSRILGIPRENDQPNTEGLVVLNLPQGDYDYRLYGTPVNSGFGRIGNGTLNLGCRQIVSVYRKLQLYLDTHEGCVQQNTVLTGKVSSNVPIAAFTYSLNGGEPQDILDTIDSNGAFSAQVSNLEVGSNTVTYYVLDQNGRDITLDMDVARGEPLVLLEPTQPIIAWTNPGETMADVDIHGVWLDPNTGNTGEFNSTQTGMVGTNYFSFGMNNSCGETTLFNIPFEVKACYNPQSLGPTPSPSKTEIHDIQGDFAYDLVRSGDVDSDGNEDLLAARLLNNGNVKVLVEQPYFDTESNLQWARSTSVLTPVGDMSQTKSLTRIGDWDEDGSSDLLLITYDNASSVYLETIGHFNSNTDLWGASNQTPLNLGAGADRSSIKVKSGHLWGVYKNDLALAWKVNENGVDRIRYTTMETGASFNWAGYPGVDLDPSLYPASFLNGNFYVGDVNGDNLDDILFLAYNVYNRGKTQLLVLMNKGETNFEPQLHELGPADLTAGTVFLQDVDGDARDDLVSAGAWGGSNLVVQMWKSECGDFWTENTQAFGTSFKSGIDQVRMGDVNNDDRADIMLLLDLGVGEGMRLRRLLFDSNTQSWTGYNEDYKQAGDNLPTGYRILSADINGDQKTDYCFVNRLWLSGNQVGIQTHLSRTN